jgi:outer membrane receptor protein involved in Fe transport
MRVNAGRGGLALDNELIKGRSMSRFKSVLGISAATMTAVGGLSIVPVTGYAQIEEITVTTRKRTESLQDVPIAVDAITTEQIERQGLSELQELTRLSPSVQFDQSFGPADTRIAIRGLSNTRGRSNVAFLVDGIDVTTENLISAGSGLLANQRLLGDVERIEIVKGPQSALYGRAAFAGAISYITKEPGPELEGRFRVDGAEDGFLQVDGAFGGPVPGLEDTLGIRATGAWWTDDGSYTNSLSGTQLGGEEGWGAAVTAVFTPNDVIKFKGRVEYTDNDQDLRPVIRVGSGTAPGTLENYVLREYPQEAFAINPDTGAPALGAGSFTATGLLDFGQYCPDALKDPTRGPGYCFAESYGEVGNRKPAYSEDPSTGKDYEGTDTELFRASFLATIDMDWGTFTSNTGWTDYDAFDEYDQDYQAIGRPDTLKAAQQARTALATDQFSQELRFGSNFGGALQFTVGGFYWEEERQLADSNFIIACIENGKNAALPIGDPERVWPGAAVSGICDGVGGTITSWQERALDVFPCEYDPVTGLPLVDPNSPTGNCLKAPVTPAPWRADTEHWSVYVSFEWELSDAFKLTVENRTVWEDFDLLRPNVSSCTYLGAPFGLTPFIPLVAEADPVTNARDDIVCRNEQVQNPNLPAPALDPNGNDWFLIEGSEDSYFNTPSVKVEWTPTDDALIYFSWARGQKPGGINQLAAGGTTTNIDDERFDSEKVDAWEIGAKTSWELAGALQVNSSLFFNDYTDKQIGTQVVRERGDGALELQPRVVNASAAEVWGLELDVTWAPSFLEGLIVSAAYTYLDTEFVDFQDRTRSLARSAIAGNCTLVYVGDNDEIVEPGTGGTPFCQINLNGKRLERTPENAFVSQFQLTRPFFDQGFDWFVEFTANFEDERFLDADNFIKFDDYWIVDARAGIEGESWEFLVYVNNLLDDDTIRTGGSGPDFAEQVSELGFTAGLGVSHYFGVLPDPQIFGARLTIRF